MGGTPDRHRPSSQTLLAVITFRHRDRPAATAGHHKHAQRRRAPGSFGFTAGLHPASSTVAIALFFLLFDCSTFFRKRSDFGVISTYSSSEMNSIACSRFS